MPGDDEEEDLERMPDGIPHGVVALTVFYALALAITVVVVLLHRRDAIAIALAAIAVPVIVAKLARKAEHDRDHLHPSR